MIKIGTRQKLSRCDPNSSVQIGNDNIIATSSVRNLGYYWNSHMKDNVHVNKSLVVCSKLLETFRKLGIFWTQIQLKC